MRPTTVRWPSGESTTVRADNHPSINFLELIHLDQTTTTTVSRMTIIKVVTPADETHSTEVPEVTGADTETKKGNQTRLTGDFSNKKCFNCGVQGHIIRFCPSRPYNNAIFYDSTRRDEIIYFNCQQPSHVARYCMMARRPDNSSWRCQLETKIFLASQLNNLQ